MSTQSQCSPGMLRHFACPRLLMQCSPSPAQSHLEIWGSWVGWTSSPRIPRALLHLWDASSQGRRRRRAEEERWPAVLWEGPDPQAVSCPCA